MASRKQNATMPMRNLNRRYLLCREKMERVRLAKVLSVAVGPEWEEAAEAGWVAIWLPVRVDIVYVPSVVKGCRINRGCPAVQ